MDDGSRVGKGLKLCTNCFTYKECLLQSNLLRNNYKLKVSIQKTGAPNQYQLYIYKQSIPLLWDIVQPFIHPSMKYKFAI